MFQNYKFYLPSLLIQCVDLNDDDDDDDDNIKDHHHHQNIMDILRLMERFFFFIFGFGFSEENFGLVSITDSFIYLMFWGGVD